MATTMGSVAIYFAIWRLPDADRNIVYVLYVLGPMLMAVGGIALYQYMTVGVAPTKGGNFFYHVARLFALVWHRVSWENRHHVPREGGCIVASNHTSAMDPLVLQAASPRMIRWLMLTSYRFKLVEPMWRAIDPICLEHEKGKDAHEPGPQQVRTIVRALRDDQLLGVFPEGHLQYDNRKLKPFLPGVAVMAKLGKASILPAWISGTVMSDSIIKHMLKPSRSRVIFGKPYTPDPNATPEEVMADLRRRLLKLAWSSQPAREGKCPACHLDLPEPLPQACPNCQMLLSETV
jgi:1-acyl-sn-glycerol-3-phosphate acyltransferase